MTTIKAAPATAVTIPPEAVGNLIHVLQERGFEVIGPTIRDGAIIYDSIHNLDDLPRGWAAEQTPGRYRLKKRRDNALFAFGATPQGLKRFLHPPEACLFRAERNGGQFKILTDDTPPPKYAFLGVRACDLAAVERQDRVLIQDRYSDPAYQARREASIFIAVHCSEPSANCFCASMDTGPRVLSGYDILLTERIQGDTHSFTAKSGTSRGEELLLELPGTSPAMAADGPQEVPMQKSLDTADLKELLYESFEHPRWDQIALRCLMCGNCTAVCPTCFCVTVEDSSDVKHQHAERWRRWDSCLTQSFSYIHGGSVRMSPKSRYRQWLTHKFAAWTDQFGEPGCVGCGRCITWCPAGIDITEELAGFRDGRSGSGTQSI